MTIWKKRLQSFLDDLNRTCVDGQADRLLPYFRGEALASRERRRWEREWRLRTERETHPLAAKTKAALLQSAELGAGEVEVVLLLHQQLHYRQKDSAFFQENRRIQRVRMKRVGDRWEFVTPWGSFFSSAQQSELPESGETNDQGDGVPAAEHELEQDFPEGVADVSWIGQEAVSAAYPPTYDRQRAVAYAEQHWNRPNPHYATFAEDCTNFVSQCLHAGGIPMVFTNNRSTGWWYRGGRNPNWSYSWAVAHSLYLMLRSGKAPFYAQRVEHASLLEIGDVICYDFDGDNRWQHNTVVVAKDRNNMPLVNAHTTESRHRYWDYRDSSAYTDRIQYGFFRMFAGAIPGKSQ